MRLSEARRMALYSAIHDEVMNARIDIMRGVRNGKPLSPDDIDVRVSRITDRAWSAVKGALFLEGEP